MGEYPANLTSSSQALLLISQTHHKGVLWVVGDRLARFSSHLHHKLFQGCGIGGGKRVISL